MTRFQKCFGPISLFIAALVWGVAFVAQSEGMKYVGPFTFQTVRFFIGGVVLLPVIAVMNKLKAAKENVQKEKNTKKQMILRGLLCGAILSIASTFQQVGIAQGADPGKAGFITALYVILVPLLGIFLGKKPRFTVWICVALALGGLWLLCVSDPKEGLTVRFADILVLISSFFYSFHILLLDKLVPDIDGVKLSCIQFFAIALISAVPMLLTESVTLEALSGAAPTIAYAGFCSCGIAYTFQAVGQKYTAPALASLIMSLESVFAVLASMVILQTLPTLREAIGCLLMFAAIILALLPKKTE